MQEGEDGGGLHALEGHLHERTKERGRVHDGWRRQDSRVSERSTDLSVSHLTGAAAEAGILVRNYHSPPAAYFDEHKARGLTEDKESHVEVHERVLEQQAKRNEFGVYFGLPLLPFLLRSSGAGGLHRGSGLLLERILAFDCLQVVF